LEDTTFKLHPNSLIEDGTGSVLETVGGEFQPSFETVHSGGGAHLYFVLEQLCQLSPAAAGLSQFCQLKDIINLAFLTIDPLL